MRAGMLLHIADVAGLSQTRQHDRNHDAERKRSRSEKQVACDKTTLCFLDGSPAQESARYRVK